MKNKCLIITMIILLSIIVIGLIALLYFVISGKHKFYIGLNKEKTSEDIIYEESYELDKIDCIEVLSSAGNVKFEENTDGKIKVVVYGKNNGKLRVDLNNNKLRIDYPEKINFFGINSYMNEIIVYVPQNYSKEIKIDLDYGNVEILDLEQATIDIKEDCGNVNLGKIKNVTIKNDYGDIEIEEVLNKLNIKSNCGNIKIDNVKLLEDSIIKSDLGDVIIDGTNDIFIDADVDLGDTKVNNNNRQAEITLEIKVDCGNIKVDN
ncbi:MAG: DUF4097 domain-containing protein [Clostridia bacterium]|nr:DUF4097 domain-containing protein [Clostridia bacterium]